MNLTIEIRAKPEKFYELYHTSQALLPTMRAEGGSRESLVFRDVEDGEVFLLSVSRENATNLEHYMQ